MANETTTVSTGSPTSALWQQLQDAGLTQGDMPQPVLRLPWYLRVLQGFAGWLAGCFLLLFLGVLFNALFRQAELCAVFGSLLVVVAALWLRRPHSDFGHQFAFALSLAGQWLWLLSLQNEWRAMPGWLGLAVAQAALAWLVPHYLHRLLCTWMTVLALAFALRESPLFWVLPGLTGLLTAGVWLQELRWLPQAERVAPVAYALTFAVLWMNGLSLLPVDVWQALSQSNALAVQWGLLRLNEYMHGATLLLVVTGLLHQHGVTWRAPVAWAALAAALLLAVLSLHAGGLAVAWTLILLGFARSNRVLQGIGFTAFWGFFGHYYLSMDWSLWQKAGWLLALGSVLLLLRALLLQVWKEHQ